jgi:Fe-coproporphyrin III synthase
MPTNYARICQDWVLRGWESPSCALFNWKTGKLYFLNKSFGYVSKNCYGQTDFSTPVFLPKHRAILDHLISNNIVERCKPFDTVYSAQVYRRAPNPFFHRVQWAVTGRCNLNCRHCFVESPQNTYGELQFDEIARMVEEFEHANVLEVVVSGGEPLFRNDIIEILSLLTEKRIRVDALLTNGTLLNTEMLNRIRALGITPPIQISFDGLGFHDRMRGIKDCETKVINAIRISVEMGFEVVVSTAIDRASGNCLDETYELLKSLKISKWNVFTPIKIGNWASVSDDINCWDAKKLFIPLVEKWQNDGKLFALALSDYFNGISGEDIAQDQNYDETQSIYACSECRSSAFLLSNGVMLPCGAFTGTSIQPMMPNLRHTSLSEIWKNSNLRRHSGIMVEEIMRHNAECRECSWFSHCLTGCRAAALIETGNVMNSDPVTCAKWKGGYYRQEEGG